MKEDLVVYFCIAAFFGIGVYALFFSRHVKRGMMQSLEQGHSLRGGSVRQALIVLLSPFLPKNSSLFRQDISLFWIRLLGIAMIGVAFFMVWWIKRGYLLNLL